MKNVNLTLKIHKTIISVNANYKVNSVNEAITFINGISKELIDTLVKDTPCGGFEINLSIKKSK